MVLETTEWKSFIRFEATFGRTFWVGMLKVSVLFCNSSHVVSTNRKNKCCGIVANKHDEKVQSTTQTSKGRTKMLSDALQEGTLYDSEYQTPRTSSNHYVESSSYW